MMNNCIISVYPSQFGEFKVWWAPMASKSKASEHCGRGQAIGLSGLTHTWSQGFLTAGWTSDVMTGDVISKNNKNWSKKIFHIWRLYSEYVMMDKIEFSAMSSG